MGKYKVIFYLLPLFALVFGGMMYYGPDGFFEKMKDIVGGTEDFVPTVGLRNLSSPEISVDPAVQLEAKALKNTLLAMANSKESNCFQTFGGFSELGKDVKDNLIMKGSVESVIFLFTHQINESGGKDFTEVVIKAKKSVEYDRFSVPGMKPCVIAGSDAGVKAFGRRYVEGKGGGTPQGETVRGVNIYWDDVGSDGNRLRVVDSNSKWNKIVNDQPNNFENDGMLFKGDDGAICFFPTNYVVNYDEDGMDNDLLYDMGDSESLSYKLKTGKLKTCTDAVDLQAIEVYMDDDASDEELDCENKKPISREIYGHIHQLGNSYSTENNFMGTCSDVIKKNIGSHLPENGCWLFMVEDDDTDGLDCGWVELAPGEVVPGKNREGNALFPLKAPRFEKTDPLCLLNNYKWTNNKPNDLLCKKNSWKQCGPAILGTKEEVDMTTFDKAFNPQYPISKIEYTCVKSGSDYIWNTTGTQYLPWFTYEGIELANEDNDVYRGYPKACDTGKGEVFEMCFWGGDMGVTTSKNLDKGMFICPSDDQDCDKEFRGSNSLPSKGCNIWLSEEDGSNDCSWGVTGSGEYLDVHNARDFWDCKDGQKKCPPKSPINVPSDSSDMYDNDALCLLRMSWYPFRGSFGGLLCSYDHMWLMCEQRKEGSCIKDDNKKVWCCKKTDKGYYEFFKGTEAELQKAVAAGLPSPPSVPPPVTPASTPTPSAPPSTPTPTPAPTPGVTTTP